MKKYRKVRGVDKLPIIPKHIMPLYYGHYGNKTYIFGIDLEKNYTIEWDGVSNHPTSIIWAPKEEIDLHLKYRRELSTSQHPKE